MKKSKLGNCYEVAGRYMLDNMGGRLILVHGEVEGQGAIKGIRYGHAWIEDGETVIDNSNGNNIKMSKKIYYLLGHITNTYRYDSIKFNKRILKYKTWGPWDLKTSSGL